MSALPSPCVPDARASLCELSSLTGAASLIRDPGIRLEGLAALLVAVTAWGGGSTRIRAGIATARQELHASGRLRGELAPVLDELLAAPTPGLSIQLARINAAQRRHDPRFMVSALLDLGLVDAARQAAEALPRRPGRPGSLRTAAIRLAQTGIRQGRDRQFVASALVADRFPASLPAFIRCAQALLGPHPQPAIRDSALRILGQLSFADRQQAMVLWCLVRWREEGEAAALSVLEGIRYRSRRSEAGLRLVEAALLDEQPQAAARIAARIPAPGAATAAALLQGGAAPRHSLAPLVSLTVHRVIARLHTDTLIPAELLDELRQWLSDADAMGMLIQAMAASGQPMIPQVRRLHALLGSGDRLWCALLVRRGMALLALAPAAPALPSPPTTADATSPERAAHDEWIALGPEGHARRRVLARACRAALLAAIRGGEVPRIRLRTLGHIGGDIALRVLHELLPRATGTLRLEILRQILSLAPGQLARMLAAQTAHIPDGAMPEILAELELRRRLPAGSTEGWALLCAQTTPAWRTAFLAQWRARSSTFPSPQHLAATAEEVRQEPDIAPDALLSRAQAALATLKSAAPEQLIDALLASPLLRQRLRWSRPASLPARMSPWGDEKLVDALKLAAAQGEVSAGILRQTIQALRPDIAEPLRHGRCPLPELSVLTVGSGVELRYLDKGMDLLTFFRFADPAACCWNSTGSNFRSTQSRLLAVWRDPLSFCFHLSRIHPRAEPIGFVFGSLALSEAGEPTALLNGLYLARQSGPLRDATLRALERFFAHLGVRWLGVACRYNGSGPMPERYQLDTRQIHRPRALRLSGAMVTQATDDISAQVNHTLSLRLHWLNLEPL